MAERKYFGTDGIRGRVGEGPITPEFALRLGRAIAHVLTDGAQRSVYIGKDTRISGYMLESALEAGLSAGGAKVKLLGPMPTPAVAHLTRSMRGAAGIVISASHNLYVDNGFKFFSGRGEKLPDDTELAIEAAIDEELETVPAERLGKAVRVDDAVGRYIEFCKSTVPYDFRLDGLKVVVDCAHGATYKIAPRVFRELGAWVWTIGTEPDGFNINDGCGSTQLGALSRAVVEHGADLGIAFDGDGDRMLMVDHEGRTVDGDQLLYIIARDRKSRGVNRGGVVGTLMSNFGLQLALADMGMDFVRAQVGDRYVLEQLRDRDWLLGGETSGHILTLDRSATGDGVVSALTVLEALQNLGQSLAEAVAGMQKFPQVMINVPVNGGFDPEQPAIARACDRVRDRLGDEGRLILRPSGTEPVVRVTVEGRDENEVRTLAEELASVVEENSQ